MSQYYCNPVNIDYRYQFYHDPRSGQKAVAREAADPSLILFHGKYYLFASMTLGVWVSEDLVHWSFHRLPDDLPLYDYAPDARVVGDWVYLCASALGRDCDHYRTRDIENGPYEKISGTFPFWDPNLFLDDDGRLYFYWGCSSVTPLYGVELDPKTLRPLTERKEILFSHPMENGFERNGDDNRLTPLSDEETEARLLAVCAQKGLDPKTLPPDMIEMGKGFLKQTPYLEGSWMTKHGGKYYLQYAVTGTHFNVYADGVAVSDSPLGPFKTAENNPYSCKLGGFIEGAGHGSTLKDLTGAWWHTATMRISVNHVFERRVGLWPAGFDGAGNLFCSQRYGDWPINADKVRMDPFADPDWMLLGYQAKAAASSSSPGKGPELAVNEDIRTWWQAGSNKPGEWLSIDLGAPKTVHAVQINFADDRLDLPAPGEINKEAGRYIDPDSHATRWILESSLDGEHWEVFEDKSKADTCLPHDFLVREDGVVTRYLRLTVTEVPFGVPACISGLRVFGKAEGDAPKEPVYAVSREGDLDAKVTIEPGDGAVGHVVTWGMAPDRLYHSKMTFANEVRITSLMKDRAAYVRVETFNESGITKGQKVIRI